MLSDNEWRAAATRHRRKETEARKRAETEAKRKSKAETKRTGAEEETTRAEAEGGKKDGVEKKKKSMHQILKDGAGPSSKRRRSRSPPTCSGRGPETMATPIDLTVETPPEERGVEVPPSLPVAPEVEGTTTVVEPGPSAIPSVDGPPPDVPTSVPDRDEPPMPPSGEEEEAEAAMITLQAVLDQGKWAERQISQICPPGVQQSLLKYRSADFFREANASLYWIVNSFTSLRTAFAQADTAYTASQSETEAVRVQLGEVEKVLEDTRAAEKRAVEASEVAQRQVALEVEKSCKAEEELRSLQAQVLNLMARAQEAEERADGAETRARAASEEIKALREKAVEEAKKKAEEVEVKVAEAVAVFQQSDAYKKQLADSAAYVYDLGFKDCKLKVKQTYNLEGVEDLEPDSIEDPAPSPPRENDAVSPEP